MEKQSENANTNAAFLSPDDLHNLEVIFLQARKTVVENEAELLNLITFKKNLSDKIREIMEERENTISNEDIRNLEVVFLYARRATIEHEMELLNVIRFKQTLLGKFSTSTK